MKNNKELSRKEEERTSTNKDNKEDYNQIIKKAYLKDNIDFENKMPIIIEKRKGYIE